MPKHQCRKTMSNRKDNTAPLEPNDPITARSEHNNAAEAQESLKNNLMTMIEVLKEKIKKNT